MVRFTLNGAMIALVEEPNWVRMQENGCFGHCDLFAAEGVVIDGIVYNLPGHSITANSELDFEIVEDGAYIMQKNIETEQMITELDIANIEAQQAITELELMILGG